MTAAWMWLILLVLVVAVVAGWDLYASAAHVPSMTAQMHTWIEDKIIGPFIIGALVAIPAGLAWHFIVKP